jgi:hypothetical protein
VLGGCAKEIMFELVEHDFPASRGRKALLLLSH